MRYASAIYEPLVLAGWIGRAPPDRELVFTQGAPIPSHWTEVVSDRRLSCGIGVTIQRRGFGVYDFSSWPPGRPRANDSQRLRTMGAASSAAKPALIQRLRVINCHLTLIHGASVSLDGVSPPVARVHWRDLYYFDVPEDCPEGTWFASLTGTVPDHVTAADRLRVGDISLVAVERSLDWLDEVVTSALLIEVDLLNQAQAALSTHDYPLAVVAGWTACELRLRKRGHGVPGGQQWRISRVIDALTTSGCLLQPLATRLNDLVHGRNQWLHAGTEPDEVLAVEAVRLASEMLRDSLPGFSTRAAPGLLHL